MVVRLPFRLQKLKNNTTMTKEQLMQKWGDLSSPLKNDIEAVIATEIAKAKEQQPTLNPIAEAYERGEKIRYKLWDKDWWIKKHTESLVICDKGGVHLVKELTFTTHQHDWELYTEPAEQPSSQVKLDNSFDKDRFERMFRAVVASGVSNNEFITTEEILEELDAYYASKEGGNNG